MWTVSDGGAVEVRMRAEGEQAIKIARVKAEQYIANIVSDLSENMGIVMLFDELRYSFSKTRPEVTVIWRTRVPEESADTMREYLARIAQEHSPELGEVVDGTPDQ
jgi:hypothetical protein